MTRLETADTTRYTRMDKRDVMVAVSVYCKPVFFELTTREMAHRETSLQLWRPQGESLDDGVERLALETTGDVAADALEFLEVEAHRLFSDLLVLRYVDVDIGVVYTVPVEIKLFRNERFNFRYIFKLLFLLERLPPGPFHTVAGVRI